MNKNEKDINILVVEDDEVTALNLKLSLKKFNYSKTESCDTINKAKEYLSSSKIDLVIIDISLQEGDDGIKLASHIKEKYDIPFIYLTSYSDDSIIQKAKQTEPYGYIVKPFNPESLHATIQIALFKYHSEIEEELIKDKLSNDPLLKLLNEKREKDAPVIKFGDGDYHFDLASNEIFFENKKIKLTKKENLFFKLLVAHLGEVITFSKAIEYVWGGNQATENNVRTLVWRLRNKLQTDVIKSASGIGYYLQE
ncbi:Chemotaxis regulator-transmits chemoreceptor signals to flagelllar motor components CheY [hydrothermal vent metagenome]|uniref:Chemotaxis regulator-transmits chemoreceptor signals to flagelllar motor components CheY n=1 Tax=hydrothermal vent metagenome TaxID=652676 RepID=A0A1W1B9B9_9ZZZZ